MAELQIVKPNHKRPDRKKGHALIDLSCSRRIAFFDSHVTVMTSAKKHLQNWSSRKKHP